MLDDPLKPGGKATWWLERVIVWVEVPTMLPWTVDGYKADPEDIGVTQFWYDCLRTFLQVRAEVQAAWRADPTIQERRAERDKYKGAYKDYDPDNPEGQDPDGEWDDNEEDLEDLFD